MDETLQSPPRQRRSSILRRSIAPPPSTHFEGPSVNAALKDSESKASQLKCPGYLNEETGDINHLTSGLQKLTAEQVAWKNLRAERKKLKNPDNWMKVPPQLSWDAAQRFFSEKDKAFLKSEPLYVQIYEDYDRLVKEAAWLRVKYERCCNLGSCIQRIVQSRFDSIKRHIGEYNENKLDLPEPTK